tara:strand:- start:980 stop:1528 length:549 start_codon:yes stop_codon:yes gene_type:complete
MTTAYAVDLTIDRTSGSLVEAGSYVGKMRVAMDTIALATTDIDDDDIIHMVAVPSNAKIVSIKLSNDDLDSNGSPTLVTDVGLYAGETKFTDTDGSATAYAAGAVIDRDCYGTTMTTLQAAASDTEVLHETRNINAISNFVWEDGGLTSDPGVPLYISLTIETVAATAVAGDVTMVVTYVVN